MNGLTNRIQEFLNSISNRGRTIINKIISGKIYWGLIILLFFSGCGLTQFKTVMTYDDATNTATMISNVPATGEVKGAKISQERSKSILNQISDVIPKDVNVEK